MRRALVILRAVSMEYWERKTNWSGIKRKRDKNWRVYRLVFPGVLNKVTKEINTSERRVRRR